MGDFQCFVSCALALNTLASFLSLDGLKHKDTIALRDLSGIGTKIIARYDRTWRPLIHRMAFFEIIICLWLLAFNSEPPPIYTAYSRFILFAPQIATLTFIIGTEFTVFTVLCWRSAFKNNRPYWVSLIEFLFIFTIFGSLDILFPPLFDFLSNLAFETTKPDDTLNNQSTDEGSPGDVL